MSMPEGSTIPGVDVPCIVPGVLVDCIVTGPLVATGVLPLTGIDWVAWLDWAGAQAPRRREGIARTTIECTIIRFMIYLTKIPMG